MSQTILHRLRLPAAHTKKYFGMAPPRGERPWPGTAPFWSASFWFLDTPLPITLMIKALQAPRIEPETSFNYWKFQKYKIRFFYHPRRQLDTSEQSPESQIVTQCHDEYRSTTEAMTYEFDVDCSFSVAAQNNLGHRVLFSPSKKSLIDFTESWYQSLRTLSR